MRISCLVILGLCATVAGAEGGVEVAAYYFPNYHPDATNAKWHGPGWTEWELLKVAQPRFDGHDQPKVPAWGYEDESDPAVMAKKIDAAADHGLDAFIFDWYWYAPGQYLHGGLERGFLQAPNNERLKFGIMWANHDWLDIQPAQRSSRPQVLLDGPVSLEVFRQATDHVIDVYFSHPSYWRVNGGLYFSIYELMTLVKGLGGMEAARDALADFRARVKAAGLGELHLNAVVWGVQILPNEQQITQPNEMLSFLGFDSVTSYVWIHHQVLPDFPQTDYAQIREASIKDWTTLTEKFTLPYFPNATMGWDSSPRTIQSDVLENTGYPYMASLKGNTPGEFRKAIEAARAFLEKSDLKTKVLTINAWNEWTEGSYLEPDTKRGMGYLEAIREVFGE
jgi:hypothetical protein